MALGFRSWLLSASPKGSDTGEEFNNRSSRMSTLVDFKMSIWQGGLYILGDHSQELGVTKVMK